MSNYISAFFSKDQFEFNTKKSRIQETLNLSTDADHRTNNFFLGGDGKKKLKFKKITCDT